MYRGELLYLQIFSWLRPPTDFVKRELPFPHGLKSHMHIGYCAVGESRGNDNVRR